MEYKGMTVLALLLLACLSPTGSALKLKDLEVDSTWSFTDHEHPPEKQMLFVHFEKSAGSYIDSVLKAAVGDNYKSYHNPSVPITDVPNDYFVVASIRDPCDQAVSSWEYLCEKTYLQRVYGYKNSAAVYQTQEARGMCPTFIGNQTGPNGKWEAFPVDPNYDGFLANLAGAEGLYQGAIMGNLQNMGLDRVNCWVRFENLQDSMSRCLQEFQEATGKPVDEGIVPLASLTSRTMHQGTDSHHSGCKDYFPNTAAGRKAESEVRRGNAQLFEYFNFTCCA
mmetsp:Transcript_114331/g.243833  ORF Transcript_114331/g.243833 Transcript_114331/m.243833 type:complete len:280 (+) Transcript_114331:73-912(+)